MIAGPTSRRWFTRCARALGVALLCTGAAAATTSAATLSVGVPSHSIRRHHIFQIKLSGRYRAAELRGAAFLVAAFQYDAKPCPATGADEATRSDASFFFSKRVSPSPFMRRAGFSAGKPGPRRICAYLYPKVVAPKDTTLPIATASGLFRVVR